MLLLSLLVAIPAVLAVVAALIAARHAASCLMLASRLSATIEDAKKHALRIDELSDTVAHLSDRYDNLRARVGMREVRAHRGKNNLEGLTGQAWKDAMRKAYTFAASPQGPVIRGVEEKA